jgi:HPt (histidine-containing phosphotransfer) domain-containing protein
MADGIIDLATFRALQETTGAEFVSELVSAFLEEAPTILEDLRSAFDARDAERFKRAAHSLKSNANTFGALGFGAKARELELAGLARVLEAKGDPVVALADEYQRVATALSELSHA